MVALITGQKSTRTHFLFADRVRWKLIVALIITTLDIPRDRSITRLMRCCRSLLSAVVASMP